MSLKNHSIIIAGASRGVGRAIAIELAKQGATLGLLARNEEQLRETAQLCIAAEAKAFPFVVDINDHSAVNEVIETFISQQGSLDIVVQCQGIMYNSFLVDDDTEQWRKVLATNLLSCIHLTRITLPLLMQEKVNHHKRAIIYISSIAGKQAFAGGSAYCASKYGLLGFAHSIFEEVRNQGIKISVICPGYINTTMISSSANLDRERMIQPADIAQLVNEIILSPITICPVEIIVRPQFPPYLG